MKTINSNLSKIVFAAGGLLIALTTTVKADGGVIREECYGHSHYSDCDRGQRYDCHVEHSYYREPVCHTESVYYGQHCYQDYSVSQAHCGTYNNSYHCGR